MFLIKLMGDLCMTRQEIGRKGGQARAAAYSSEELSQQSRKGAETIEKHHPGFHARIGAKGGKVRANKYSPEQLSEQAQKSAATIEKIHPGFHAQIGSKGGKSRNKKNKDHLVTTQNINIKEELKEN